MESLRLAAERGGSRPPVLASLGLAYEQLGRLGDAETAYAEAAARARDDARIHLGWGIVALKAGDAALAAERLDRARELYGGTAPAVWFWARGLAAAVAGEFESAEVIGESGVQAHGHSAVLRNNLAVLCELRGDLDAAEQLLVGARRDQPSLPQLSKNLGDLAYRRGRYDDAWEAYQRVTQLAPELGDDVYFKLGNIAFKRRDSEQAAELWQRALERNPHHELARANLDSLGSRS